MPLQAALALSGNPSSVHAEGRAARRAGRGGARAGRGAGRGAGRPTCFSPRAAPKPTCWRCRRSIETASDKRPRDRLLISAIEHASVRAGGRFPREADRGHPSRRAMAGVNLAALAEAVAQSRTRPLVSLMLANNETGVIQPVAEAAAIVHAAGGLAPCRRRAGGRPHPLRYRGARRRSPDALGAQDRRAEGRRRPGAARATISISPIRSSAAAGRSAGCAPAPKMSPALPPSGRPQPRRARRLKPRRPRMLALRNRLEAGLQGDRAADGDFRRTRPSGCPIRRFSPLEGMKAETAVIAFDLEGIAVSSGAACSSGKVQPSHVLAAMGVSPALLRGRGARQPGLGQRPKPTSKGFSNAWRKLATALSKGQRGIAA